MWQGITLLGNPNLPLDLNVQSSVFITGNGKIENALCGITVKNGGIVNASFAHFVNNKTSVKFEPLAQGQSGTSGTFILTNFVVNNNYFTNPTDFEAHIKMENSGSVIVAGSNFSNTAFPNNGNNNAISTFNSALYVNSFCAQPPCKIIAHPTFSGFNTAISANNSGKVPAISVKSGVFTNNKYGVAINAVNNSQLIDNDFQLPQTISYGAVVCNATGYKIEENHFRTLQPDVNITTIGLMIDNSGIAENEVYKNQYTNLYLGQNFTNRNAEPPLPIKGILKGLQTLCNTFYNSQYEDIFVGSLRNMDSNHYIRKEQGNMLQPAGNKFSQNITPHFVSNSSDSIHYYHNLNDTPVVSGKFGLHLTQATNFCASNNGKSQRNYNIEQAQYQDYLSIAEIYLAENNFEEASLTITKMYKQFRISEEQFSELKGMEAYISWLQQLEEKNKSIYKLSENEIEHLTHYVATNTGRGKVFANNILCVLYNICPDEEFYDEIIRGLDDEMIRELDDEIINLRKSVTSVSSACLKKLEEITLVPNPTTGELRITNYELRNGLLSVEVEVFDVYGRKVSSNHHIISSSHHHINISHLSSGIYFVKIKTDVGEVIKKVIKQ
jgi:hypothetical protein